MKLLNFILRKDHFDVVHSVGDDVENHEGIEYLISELNEAQQNVVEGFRSLVISKIPQGEELQYCVAQTDYSQHGSQERLVIIDDTQPFSTIINIDELTEQEMLVYTECKNLAISFI